VTTATCQATGLKRHRDKEESLFAAMLRLRRFEEKAGMLYALGSLGRPCPLGIGQEGALAALAASLEPGDTLLALDSRPTIELALGSDAAAAFQNLVPQASQTEPPVALLRLPGEPPRRLPQIEALALAAHRDGPVIVLASDADKLHACWPQLPARVLPILLVTADRKPAQWPLPQNWRVRECDGANVATLLDAMAGVRSDHRSGLAELALAIVTPPYAGHARDGGRRAAAKRNDTTDPISLYRLWLVSSKGLSEAEAAGIEHSIREEVAAAGRTISVACAP
jgi:pyruvate dehydrogenase E1 component alpha subunit